ncbi:MAG: hypothetical protein SOR93_12290 [Clostridiales Family XIII bacterium]|nr:hypothetical protein [Clostridia bacterium]MDY3012014.1 hypothetical protein [Clostridiales Family XIII bacterium]
MDQEKKKYRTGLVCALSCSVLWGVLPVYWQALRPIESSVIIFYRIFLVGVVCFFAALKLFGMEAIKKPLRVKGAKLKYFIAGDHSQLEPVYLGRKRGPRDPGLHRILHRTADGLRIRHPFFQGKAD